MNNYFLANDLESFWQQSDLKIHKQLFIVFIIIIIIIIIIVVVVVINIIIIIVSAKILERCGTVGF